MSRRIGFQRLCTLLPDVVFLVVVDLVRLASVAVHSHSALAAENLFFVSDWPCSRNGRSSHVEPTIL
jgi:hypothetical protein